MRAIYPSLAGKLVALFAVAAACGLAVPAGAANVSPPELDVTWEFECQSTSNPQSHLTVTAKTVEDGVIVMEFSGDEKSSVKYMPVSTWYLSFSTRDEMADQTRVRVIDWGSLSFETLAVGEKVSAWVRQSDTKWGRNRWQWSAEIKNKITVETEGPGTREIFIIEQTLYSAEWQYGATIINHYSPQMNMITYWKKHDSNDHLEECRLVLPETTLLILPPEEAELVPQMEGGVVITEEDILKNEELNKKLAEFYKKNPLERYRWHGTVLAFNHINNMKIIKISGNQAQIDVWYRVGSTFFSKLARGTVTVEKVGPNIRVLDFQRWQAD